MFAPDGKSVYLTTDTYDGIWEYTPATRALVQVTAEPGSGYGFTVAPDGARIAFRKTSTDKAGRTQEIVVKDLGTGTSTVVAAGREVSLPSLAAGTLVYSVGQRVEVEDEAVAAGRVTLLGIDNGKISFLKNGQRILLDPIGKGSYVWPALSPDGSLLVAVEMSRGAFVCDTRGQNVRKLGRCNAPSWTRDGKWIVFMDDRDDGHVTQSSDLFAISGDGGRKSRLTSTRDLIEMNPNCSPAANEVVCNTLDGRILLLQYAEEGR